MQEKLLDLNASLPGGLKWIFATLIKHAHPSFSRFTIFIIFISSFFSFSLWFLNFLLLNTSFDVRFLIRLILWCTHSTDFLGITPDNQIHHFSLHIFHRIMWGLMRENLFFLWPVCTTSLKPAMRLVSWLPYFILQNFSICLELIFACN